MSDLALVPDRPPTAKESLRMSLENVAPLINPKTDFASIKGKIEPTRDLILKLIDPFNLSFDTELKSKEVDGEVRRYTFKATITGPDGRTVTGWGQCGTDEVSNGERADHDAMTKAETRALKRGVEAKAGFGMVNQLILHFFGGLDEKDADRNVTPVGPAEQETIEKDVGPAPEKYAQYRSAAKKFDAEGRHQEADNARKAAKDVLTETFGKALDYRVAKREDGTWTTIRVEAVPKGAGVPDEKIPH